MRKTIYIGFAFPHHKNTCAGYHRIKEYLNYDKVIDCQSEFELHANPRNIFQRIFRRLLDITLGTETVFALIYCVVYNIFHKDCIFHFIYGENTYKNIRFLFRKSNKLVCTLHQPIEFFEKNFEWKDRLRSLDGIILMSQGDVLKFRELAPQAKVEFIPHGIDVDFYSPNGTIKRNQILMVGNWLRDFKFANEVFQDILNSDRNLSVVVVTSSQNFSQFDAHERLRLVSGISNEALRDLYRESKCLFLPLIAYTANNAVLEAAATNCPIIIATSKSSSSYLSEDIIKILPLKKDVVISNLSNPFVSSTRELVISNYSWEKVARVTDDFFSKLI